MENSNKVNIVPSLQSAICEEIPSLLGNYVDLALEMKKMKIKLIEMIDLQSQKIRNTLNASDLFGKQYAYGKHGCIFNGRTENSEVNKQCKMFTDTLHGKKIAPYYSNLLIGNKEVLNYFLSRFPENNVSESFLDGDSYLFVISRDFDMEDGNDYELDSFGLPVFTHCGFVIKM